MSNHMRILLIEDNPGDARLIQELLKDAPAPVDLAWARRLGEGLQQARDPGCDLILLDLSLPDSSGMDTFRRAAAAIPDTPIVVQTGNDDSALALEAVQAGAQDYLVKGSTDGNSLFRSARYAIERHRLRAELEASEARLRRIIREDANGIVIVDSQGTVRFVNPAAEAMFGCRADELLGRRFGIPVTLDGSTELGILRPGEQVFAEMRVVKTEWEGGQAYLASISDITERRRAEREIEQANAQLAQKNQELEQFVYTASHDLKSPLVTIQGFMGHLLRDINAQRYDRVTGFAERIESATYRMRANIDDLLELSRIGRVMKEPVLISTEEVVQRLVADLRGAIESKGVNVKIAPDLPKVYADPDRFGQVIDNLLANALKYGCAGAEPCIEIEGERVEGEVRLVVRDNGPGIPAESHERIFRLFERSDTSVEGTGVGLAIVKRIVEVHHGRVWIESRPGHGAAFWIALPDQARPLAAAA